MNDETKEIINDNKRLYKLIISTDSNEISLKQIETKFNNEYLNNVSPDIAEIISKKTVTINYEQHYKTDMNLLSSTHRTICDNYILSYDELLKYQRMINLGAFDEESLEEGSYYYHSINSGDNIFRNYSNDVINKELLDILVKSQTYDSEKPSEWDIVPDIYILFPVKYPVSYKNETKQDFETLKSHLDKAEKEYAGKTIKAIITSLKKRKKAETNIPAINISYLGKELCHIKSNENNNANELIKSLGTPAVVDFLLVWDQKSSSGVVVFCSLSSPFLLSYLLDAISNNDLIIHYTNMNDDTKTYINVEKFLEEKFKISVHGTAKSFVIIPKAKECLTPNQISALLASEAIMPSNCGFGHIIDKDIMAAARENIGQYDRADVYAYSTVLLVFNKALHGSVVERIETESITLFYIILILMEEASICIANDEVVNLLADVEANDKSRVSNEDESIEFLKKTDIILSEYSKTIDFWKAQLRYPTSQKSLDNIRAAFKVDDKLLVFKRNQQQLNTLFNIKSEIKDRMSELQTNDILFWLSILAILSVLNDSIELVPNLLCVGEVLDIGIIPSILFLLSQNKKWIQLLLIIVIMLKIVFVYRKFRKRYKL